MALPPLSARAYREHGWITVSVAARKAHLKIAWVISMTNTSVYDETGVQCTLELDVDGTRAPQILQPRDYLSQFCLSAHTITCPSTYIAPARALGTWLTAKWNLFYRATCERVFHCLMEHSFCLFSDWWKEICCSLTELI